MHVPRVSSLVIICHIGLVGDAAGVWHLAHWSDQQTRISSCGYYTRDASTNASAVHDSLLPQTRSTSWPPGVAPSTPFTIHDLSSAARCGERAFEP